MAIFDFHLIGRWLPGQVHCRWVERTFRPGEDVRQLIEQVWAQETARPGMFLFDGPMCRLEGVGGGTGRLELALSRVSYKDFMGTNMRHPELADRLGPEALANPVGISCALVSADGFLLMGRRNERVAYYPGRIHPFAGALEPREELDIFDEGARELAEEMCLEKDELAELACLGLAEDQSIRQPELICLARCVRTRQQIEERLDDAEHVGTWHLSPVAEEVDTALRDSKLLTPIGVATVLLWAGQELGQEWFKTATSALGIGSC